MSFLGYLLFALVAVVVLNKLRQVDRLTELVAGLRAHVDDLESRIAENNNAPDAPNRFAAAEDSSSQPSARAPVGFAADPPLTERLTATAEPPRAAVARSDWERNLAENWFVWAGGITLALGAVFLVKFSLDYGLLTPTLRVLLGLLAGVVFIALAGPASRGVGSEFLGAGGAVHVPPSLAAAGSSAIFASLYAAYALYDLIPPGFAFLALAATAVMAALLSLRHGPFVAGLGLLGAFAVPLMVRSDSPDALSLFIYLTLISAGSLFLLRYKKWPWLAWFSLTGAVGWTLIWISTSTGRSDSGVLCGFLFVQMTLYAAFRRGLPFLPILRGLIDEPLVRTIIRVAFWTLGTAMLLVSSLAILENIDVGILFITAVFLLWFAFNDQALDDVIGVAAFLVTGLIALWHLPLLAMRPDALIKTFSDDTVRYITTTVVGAGLLTASGFAALRHVMRPGRWASMSAAALPVLLVIAYWRLHHIIADPIWVTLSLGAAALELFALERLMRHRGAPHAHDAVLGAYAVGVTACTILGCAIALQNAWLTVAIAMHLPALAWINDRFRLPMLRIIALVLAGLTLIRLAANPRIVTYTLSDTPVFNWLLYGYGLPTIAFVAARWKFAQDKMDILIEALEACAIVFFFLLVTFEVRHLMGHGRVDLTPLGFRENAVQALTWLGMSALLLYFGVLRQRRILKWAGLSILGLGTFFAILSSVLFKNPIFAHEPVGDFIVFNYLAVAYAGPALFYGGLAFLRSVPQPAVFAARGLALAFAFFWVTMETRHLFQGTYLDGASPAQDEWYAYSAAWLVFAAVCLGVGVTYKLAWLRRCGLAGISLVIVKVFLFDMSALDGILRVLSFMGLGSVLIAIGYFYRRLEVARSDGDRSTV